MKFLNSKVVIGILATLAAPVLTYAQASLFISPPGGDYRVGSTFSVLVNVNSGGAAINAATAQINFDHTKLSVVSLGYSQSVFTLWPHQPTWDNSAGAINFTGGLPSPGFTGSDGALLRITFKANALGMSSMVFVSGSVLANDGIGTNIADNLKGAVFRIQEASQPVAPKPLPVIPTPKDEQVVVILSLEPPEFTKWSPSLKSGSVLVIEGQSATSSKILLSVTKDGEASSTSHLYADPGGKFVYIMPEVPEIGAYQFIAILEASDGRKSEPSKSILIKVEAPTTVCILGKICLGKSTLQRIILVFVFLLLVLLLLFLIIWLWLKTRELEKKQDEEVDKLSEVESELVNMIEDMGRIQSTDQSYRNQVNGDIEKLNALKEDVIREISDLKNGKKESEYKIVEEPTIQREVEEPQNVSISPKPALDNSPANPPQVEVPRIQVAPAPVPAPSSVPKVEPAPAVVSPVPIMPKVEPVPIVVSPEPIVTKVEPVPVVAPVEVKVQKPPEAQPVQVSSSAPTQGANGQQGDGVIYYDPFAVLQANLARKAGVSAPPVEEVKPAVSLTPAAPGVESAPRVETAVNAVPVYDTIPVGISPEPLPPQKTQTPLNSPQAEAPKWPTSPPPQKWPPEE